MVIVVIMVYGFPAMTDNELSQGIKITWLNTALICRNTEMYTLSRCIISVYIYTVTVYIHGNCIHSTVHIE